MADRSTRSKHHVVAARTATRPRPRATTRDRFDHIAAVVTRVVGSPFALVAAALVLALWAVSGPVFGFSDTWQLVINTATTIVTFLMVFVIQASQNRDAKAIHLKLDELLRAHAGARNEFLVIEEATQAELDRRDAEMARVAEQVAREAGHPDPKRVAKRAAQRERRSTRQPARNGRHAAAKR
jgi:low affinity Fe/Cu permease